MKADIICIGNSRGIRIPKALLEQCGFGETVNIKVEGSRLILDAVSHPRQGWEEACKAMAANKDDTLIDGPPTDFEKDQWQW